MFPSLPSYRIEHTRTNPLDNFTSTADTIEKMIGLVQQNINSPYIQAALDQIYQSMITQSGNQTMQPTMIDWCRSIFWWVKRRIKFSEDERTLATLFGITDMEDGKELLLSPSFLLQMPNPTGDCDDFSTLIATLLVATGVPHVYFCTVAADGKEPNNFTHVYVVVQLEDGTRFPLDASHGPYPGWETDNKFRLVDWVATPHAALINGKVKVHLPPSAVATPLTMKSVEQSIGQYLQHQATDFLGFNPVDFLGFI